MIDTGINDIKSISDVDVEAVDLQHRANSQK